MRICGLIGAIALGLAAAPAMGHGPAEARYLGNEGILVSRGDTKVLFDAFYAESFGGTYSLVPSAMEQAMLAGQAPFDGVDAVFISHIHPDHFNSRKTIAYLRANPTVKLYAGLDVIGALYAADVAVGSPVAKQLVAVAVAPGQPAKRFDVAGLEIEAFAIPHNGNGPIPHYAFRVTLDQAVTAIHLGDSDEADSHFASYQPEFDRRTTHVAFAPTWLLTSDSGRRVLEQRIKPVKTIGIHAEEKLRADPAAAASGLKSDVFLEPGDVKAIGRAPALGFEFEAQRDDRRRIDRLAVLGRRPVAPFGDQVIARRRQEDRIDIADRLDGDDPSAIVDRQAKLQRRFFLGLALLRRIWWL